MSDDNSNTIQVILQPEEFAEDLEKRLGRANGNIYHRRPGVEGVHDGQVMVRLKKKRYIVLDYSIVPNEADYHHASMSPYIRCPDGAGKAKCNAASCNKVGVPVLLYDSDPNEPQSLYLRSGLCFICQRNLNEKRRTQRKKPAEDKDGNPLPGAPSSKRKKSSNSAPSSGMAPFGSMATGPIVPHSRVLMAVNTDGTKRIKLAHTTEPLSLAPDAIILNGPPDPSCKSARNGHGFNEIGADLAHIAKQSLQSTHALIHAVDPTVGGGSDMMSPHHHHHQLPPTSEELARLYQTSFAGLCKSLYLLTQWKESWDAAMAAAIHAQHSMILPGVDDHNHHLVNAIPDIHHPLSPPGGLNPHDDALHHHSLSHPGIPNHPHQDASGYADAVASAAAVAAANGGPSSSQNNGLHHHDTSKADSELMAAAAAAAAATDDGTGGDDDHDAGVIEL